MPADLPALHKVQAKLRMFLNGSTEVNAVRSEFTSSVAVGNEELVKKISRQRSDDTAPVDRRKLKPEKGKADDPSGEILASVFVQTRHASGRGFDLAHQELGRRGNLISGWMPFSQIEYVARHPEVMFVELAEPLTGPTPEVGETSGKGPPTGLRRFGNKTKTLDGEDVLIGIVDVGGFDFAHPDFLDEAGKTRFVSIWDQGGTFHAPPKMFEDDRADYGSEIRGSHMDAAIAATAAGHRFPPQTLEPQSQMTPGSHGTHVASIAAGNRGVCRKAKIAGVLVSLPEEDMDRRTSFYDSTRLAHAVDYLLKVAEREGAKRDAALPPDERKGPLPVSINISLGTNGHAHDGSSAVSRWIEAALSTPGRSISVAAGNAGQEKAEFEGDVGFVMGRIHTAGRLAARGLTVDLSWLVMGNGLVDISENELEIWYSPSDRFAVEVITPDGEVIGPVEPLQFVENQLLKQKTFVSIYNELYHPANGANYIGIYLSPFFSAEGVVGVQQGEWRIRVHGEEVRDGRFHAWIERDDPRRLGKVGAQQLWRFPSFFSERTNVDRSSVSSLACGRSVMSVGNLVEADHTVSVTSSQGPTRDGRSKPEIVAPGTEILAANGFDADGGDWIAMSGTSMASPHVTGVIGLMLAVEPGLTAAQIGGILQRTARPLPGSDFSWAHDAGYGRLDAEECLREAAAINRSKDVTR